MRSRCFPSGEDYRRCDDESGQRGQSIFLADEKHPSSPDFGSDIASMSFGAVGRKGFNPSFGTDDTFFLTVFRRASLQRSPNPRLLALLDRCYCMQESQVRRRASTSRQLSSLPTHHSPGGEPLKALLVPGSSNLVFKHDEAALPQRIENSVSHTSQI